MPKSSSIYCGLLLLVVSVILAPPALAGHGHGFEDAHARERQPTVATGRDPFNKFSVDQGATWEEAFIVPKCGAPGPWDATACIALGEPDPGHGVDRGQPRQVGTR